MHIDIITVVPDLLHSPFSHSILKRAKDKNILEVELHNLRDYTEYAHKQVDDYAYGGSAGMVLMIDPIARCIEHLQSKRTYDEIIFFTPDGELMQQKMMNSQSLLQNVILICGHYKGIDHRVREHFVTKEISIGDYVLSGGELAAAVYVDAVGRLIPGVLNDETSALSDSFQDDLLAPPVYTRPEEYRGWKVPEILLSGHKLKIQEWQENQALERTKLLRPELFKKNNDYL